ncbi:5-deoxy-glucuronate isomerase [Rhodohalobacter sp. 614A]|uniref:5-deoxy-glucuronate isomerase n=1 Tax=Rhodohalobacter sp. 614A TaxID=2908649 RepID=UPI001F2EFEB5|nr:5-deoxy-glucuronate isomerase [Rhodohalobacter sp. 614A]
MSKKIFRDTAGKTGRNWVITPENSELESLGYARIILNGKQTQTEYNNPDFEAALICLQGLATVELDGQSWTLHPYDTLYIPPGHKGKISTDTEADIVEATALTTGNGEPVLATFEEINNDPELTEILGQEGCERKIHRLIDKNLPAKRLLGGLIFSKDGNWTSWPPHEHTDTKEEIYLYIEMPPPAFGIQLVYEDLETPEYLGPVYENDAVVIKRGYHPNVAVPGYPINFVWIMATLDDSMERSWAGVNTQPEFL